LENYNMRSRSLRLVASTLALGMGALSLGACTKDKGSDTKAAAAAATTTATAETLPIAAASTDTAAAGATTTAAATATTVAGPATSLAPNHNIVYTAVGAGSFLTLAKLLANADLITTMTGPGPFTVFAPTDTAFAAVPADTLKKLLADKALLTKVLTYHVMAGTTMSAGLKPEDKTLEGSTVKITGDATAGFLVNDAKIVAPDIVASNGVIHVIDKVLLPPDL
jgi:uncharacterized surface protein with fasciclin (FAS1) repeats